MKHVKTIGVVLGENVDLKHKKRVSESEPGGGSLRDCPSSILVEESRYRCHSIGKLIL